MKKTFLIFALIVSVNFIKAQGNLQFNQVKNVEVIGTTLPLNTISNIGSITVPTGKVWKIESVSSITTSNDDFSSFQNNIITLIGNHLATTTLSELHFPIWLSPGNYPIKCAATTSPLNIITSISAIEFNIIP